MSEQSKRTFLFLQGPITPFFKLIADGLELKGHRVLHINLCFGDWLFWQRAGAKNYRGKLKNWAAHIEDYLDREKVTDIILLGEQREYHKMAISAAKTRGIQVVTTDFGYLRPDWITFEHNGMSADSLFPRDPESIKLLAERVKEPDLSPHYEDSFFTQSIWDMAYHLSNSFFRVLYPFYQSNQIYHPILVYLGTGWHFLKIRLAAKKTDTLIEQIRHSNKPYFVFPLQMQNDFQIRVYSKYPNLEAAIEEVMESFAEYAPPDANLIIKVHPLDPSLINWERFCNRLAQQYNLNERVYYLDGGSLETLLEKAEGVVTINSTVGIWTLLTGRPLMTLGSAVYNVQGLTFSGSLDEFWQKPDSPDLSLRDAFIRAMAGTIQLRGVYYNQPGLAAAVAEAVERLDRNKINQPL
ncbi:MAG: capsular biosynthesis protein [Methylococcaceae bacterium]|nr:capsular biosynthesis protein [Methylococcaceae bacterium]